MKNRDETRRRNQQERNRGAEKKRASAVTMLISLSFLFRQRGEARHKASAYRKAVRATKKKNEIEDGEEAEQLCLRQERRKGGGGWGWCFEEARRLSSPGH